MTLPSWQHKAAALNALSPIQIHIRNVCDWFVNQSVEIGGDGMLTGNYGNGDSPEDAVEDHWRKLVEDLPEDRYLVIRASREDRRHVRWNGYMWQDLPVKKREGE